MNQVLYLLLILALPSISYGQEGKNTLDQSEHYFEKARLLNDIVNHLDYDHQISQIDTTSTKGQLELEILAEQKIKTLTYLQHAYEKVLKYNPKNSLLTKSFMNLGRIHLELHQFDQAREYFLKLLDRESAISSQDSIDLRVQKSAFRIHKFKAFKHLYEIEYREGNFAKSLHYLDKYKEHFFCDCVNGYLPFQEYTAKGYAKVYQALDSLDKFLEVVIPKLYKDVSTEKGGLADLTLKYLLQKYDSSYLIDELEKGFTNYTKRQVWPPLDTEGYFIDFLDQDMLICYLSGGEISDEQQYVKDRIKNKAIYKLLKNRMHSK